MEYVILVDEHDAPLGLMEKLKAHEQGALPGHIGLHLQFRF